MKTEKNILIAFILNLAFSIFEFLGGIFTGSVAIISDALHDIGDAASIGISFFLEKKSKKIVLNRNFFLVLKNSTSRLKKQKIFFRKKCMKRIITNH